MNRTASLSPHQVAQCLQAHLTIIRAELAALPPAMVNWHSAPNEWCVKEVLGHLIESEQRGFAGRIRGLLGPDEPQFVPWDQAAVAQQRRDCERDLAVLLDEFSRLREASVALVAELQDANLNRGGHHPTVGYLTIGDLIHEWVHHDLNHIRQMFASVQDYVWPSMGNSQRFYLG